MSFIDARTLPDGHRVESDICIIGTGAAGLAVANEFRSSSLHVVLLESGGLEFDEEVQALNQGRIVGESYVDLTTSWLRYFGGTTNHWTAHVRPLDAIDFEPRPHVRYSGWPFRISELAPFYDRTRRFLKLPVKAFDVPTWEHGKRYRSWRFDQDRVRTEMVQVVPEHNRRLGKVLRKAIRDADNIETYLYATVLEITPDRSLRHIQNLRVAIGTRKRMTVHSKYYVLAAGGIENARLLLLSSSVQKEGLGNQHDLVGRFFSNHFSGVVGEFYPSDADIRPDFYVGRDHPTGHAMAVLALSDKVQWEAKVPNLRIKIQRSRKVFTLRPKHDGIRSLRQLYLQLRERRLPTDLERHIANIIADVDHVAVSAYNRLRYHLGDHAYRIFLRAAPEQSPNPDSRVMLGDDLDRFGQRRVVLDWRLSEIDITSVRKSMEIFAREVGASGLGRVFLLDREFSHLPHLSFHHMGTTRMHDDPKQGLVDANSRLHGISNLFVAGSSVFPTYGTANPTFTIIALAFRLSDHLKGLFR